MKYSEWLNRDNIMKVLTHIILLLIPFASWAQMDQVQGEYTLEMGSEEQHFIVYTLRLNPVGTFYFHSRTERKKGLPSETDLYGRGSWKAEARRKFSTEIPVISFVTETGDLNEQYTLDFTGTQARWVSKSPRDKSDREVETRLRFFESQIFWIEGIDMYKK